MTERLASPGDASDSIFFELRWLEAAIDDGLRQRLAARCRTRRVPRVVATLMATSVLVPRAVLADPAPSASQSVNAPSTVRVVDSSTGKPLSGAQIVDRQGHVLGQTQANGQATIMAARILGGEADVRHPGYRTFPLVLSALRPGATVYVGLSAQPGQAPQAFPSAMPLQPGRTHVAIRKPTAKPAIRKAARPKPRTVAVKAKPAARNQVAFNLSEHATPPEPARPLAPRPQAPKPAIHKAPAHKAPAPKPAIHKAPAHKAPAPKVATRPAKSRVVPVEHEPVKMAARPAPPPVAGGTYRVREGDSLWSISARQLGNPALWGALYRANQDQIANPDLIHPGQLLHVPTEALARAAHGTHQVRVRAGDSLWHLAAAHLGDGALWPRIYRLNRDVVADPNLIYPGQVLTIPG